MNDFASITYGERDGSRSDTIAAIDALLRREGAPKFQARLSESILLDMWEKWMFLAALVGRASLMRAAVGDVVSASGGHDFMVALHAECASVAASCGFAPRATSIDYARAQLMMSGSTFTTSMMRDIKARARIEAGHVIGDLIARGRAAVPGSPLSLLEQSRIALKAYEVRRDRETP